VTLTDGLLEEPEYGRSSNYDIKWDPKNKVETEQNLYLMKDQNLELIIVKANID
jgi:hypothetical protein